MATEKVGVYRNYYGPIPKDSSGKSLPKRKWPKKRAYSWVVRWFGSDGKRYSKSFKTRKEADRWAEKSQLDVREGKTDLPEKITLKDFAEMYLKIRTGLSLRTRQEHARTLGFLQERLQPGCPIQKVSPIDARRFLSWYSKRTVKGSPIATGTINKLLRECRRIFREAVDCGLIRSNPFQGIQQEKVGQRDWHYVTPEEFHRLQDVCTSVRWRGMITLAYCCGLRVGELTNLTWPDVDFEKEIVRIVQKRGRKGISDWTPKDKDMRIVPLPSSVVSLLAQLQTAAEEGQVYLFVVGKGASKGQRIKRQNTWRDFQVIRRRAGVPNCTLHDLRKSYCTNLAGRIPMHVVQEFAGHSDIRTTRRYYIKVQPEFMEAAREAIESYLGS